MAITTFAPTDIPKDHLAHRMAVSPDGPGQQAATLLARDLNADATEEKPVDFDEFEALLRLALFGLDACVPLDFHRHA